MIKWFSSYLCNRMQRVVVDGFRSSWKTIQAGVPQGSVLGPYLFLLYINDISENLNSNVKLFADDTSLYTLVEGDGHESANILNSDLRKITLWANAWGIAFNPDKTVALLFSRRTDSRALHPDLVCNNRTIVNVTNHKHLGLFFNSMANWSNHVNFIYEKAYKKINILRMLKYKIDRKSLTTVYTSFIRPILEYASIVWSNCTQAECDLLESIQLEAIRIITGLRKGTSHNILYNEIGIVPLIKRRHLHQNITFYNKNVSSTITVPTI